MSHDEMPDRPEPPRPVPADQEPEQPAAPGGEGAAEQPPGKADERSGDGKGHGHRFGGLRRELPAERPVPRASTHRQPPVPDGSMTGRKRLLASLWPPRVTRPQLTVALLLCVLGLGLAIQVRSTNESSVLRGARQEDLVRILDELDDRTQRLEDEKQRLVGQRTELENSSDQAEEARRQTKAKEQQLGVLAGTVAAQGPGITLRIDDTRGAVEADMLLDAIQELRAAGAEAIHINEVRVVADTYLADGGKGIEIDGHEVSQPYEFTVIGKPEDLEPALNIPGGVVQTLEKERANVSIKRHEKIVVDALRSAKRPDYARSSS